MEVGILSSTLLLETKVFGSLLALPGTSSTQHEMADGAGLKASSTHTWGPNHISITTGKFVEVFLIW